MNEEHTPITNEMPVSDKQQDWKHHFITVTPLSKLLAMLLFIALPFVGFWMGVEYGKSAKSSNLTYTEDKSAPDSVKYKAPEATPDEPTAFEVNGASMCPDGMVPVEGKLFEDSPTCEIGIFVEDETSCANLSFWWHRTDERMAKLISVTSSIDADYPATLYSRTHGLRVVHIDGLEVASFSTLDLFSEEEIQDFYKVPLQQFVYGGQIFGCDDDESYVWGALYTHTSADPPQPASHTIFKIDLESKTIQHFPLIAPYGGIHYNSRHNSFLYERYPEGTWEALYEKQGGPVEIRLLESDSQADRALVTWDATSVAQLEPTGDFIPTRRTPSPRWISDTTIEYFDYDTGSTTVLVVY